MHLLGHPIESHRARQTITCVAVCGGDDQKHLSKKKKKLYEIITTCFFKRFQKKFGKKLDYVFLFFFLTMFPFSKFKNEKYLNIK